MHNPAAVQENDTHKLLRDLDPSGSPYLGQSTRFCNKQQLKKRNRKIVDFAVPADHKIKLKECEKKDKYLDLAKEWKKTMEDEGDDYTNRD